MRWEAAGDRTQVGTIRDKGDNPKGGRNTPVEDVNLSQGHKRQGRGNYPNTGVCLDICCDVYVVLAG